MKKLLFLFSLVFAFNNIFSQTTWYWADYDGNHLYSDANNWDDGLGGLGNPAAGDDIVFDGIGFTTDGCTIDVSTGTLSSITIVSGYTGTITLNNGITIATSADFDINDGVFTGGNASSTITIGGNYNQTGGSFTKPPATMAVTGNINISGGAFIGNSAATNVTGSFNISNGSYSGSSGAVSITNGGFVQTGGNYTATSGTTTINKGGFQSSAGVFSPDNGTFLFNTNSQLIQNTPTFNNLTLANSTFAGVITYTINATITVNNTLTLNWATSISALRSVAVVTGTINALGDVLMISKSTASTGGGNATINISGSGTQNLNGASGGGAVPGDGRFPNITINSSGTVNMISTIPVAGNWTYTGGTVSTGTCTISFYGSNVNGGSMVFNNVNINNTVTLTGSCNIASTGVLTLTGNSTFITSGQTCTLLSDALGTASIAAIPGTAALTGNITMQRFIPGGTTGWAFVGSPISGKTVNDWEGEIPIACPSGCSGGTTGSSSNFSSVLYFDETTASSYTNGYIGATDATSLGEGQGFWVYMGTGASTTGDITMSLTGAPYTGSVPLPVTYSSGNNPSSGEDGWNLLSNPYPSAIDVDNAGFSLSNIDATIYVYDADLNGGAGDFDIWNIGSPGSNTGYGVLTNILPAWQGFYVHANASGPSLNVSESAKNSGNPTYMKTSKIQSQADVIKLTLNGLGFNTSTSVVFKSGATNNFDGQYDAYKLFGSNPLTASICSKWNGIYYAYNNLPQLTGDVSVPIRVKTGTAGTYKISADNLNQVLPNSCIVLYDNYSGTSTNLRTGSYTFTANDTTDAPRFMLKISAINNPITLSNVINNPSNTSSSDGSIVSSPSGTGPWTYTWKNVLDSVIRTKSNSLLTSDTLKNIPAGVYSVEVDAAGAGICGAVVQTFTLSVSSLGIAKSALDKNVAIINNETGCFVQFSYNVPTNVIISAYDVIGQKVVDDMRVEAVSQKVNLDIKNADNQIILISVKSQDGVLNKKIFRSVKKLKIC